MTCRPCFRHGERRGEASMRLSWHLDTREGLMPLYFFDSGDSKCFLRGDVGVDLPGPQEACDEAIRLLPSIARDMSRSYDGQDIVSMVRNEQNQAIFKATLSLEAEWLIPHSETDLPP